ncbi:MAG: glycosyltransferase [Candidatus Aminicenantes bacterium]|nr:glycosyltransferase [Candidatus Aminicenantes bacterium]
MGIVSPIYTKQNFCVVVPTKNEEGTIGEVLDQIKSLTRNILVVDGHSVDRTLNEVKKREIPYVLDHKKGKGDALKTGVRHCKQDIIVFIDADGSHDASDIPRLVKPIQDNKADMVVASRILGGSDELHGTFNKFIRNTGTNFLAVLVNKKYKTELSDIENGFRAIRRDVFESINLNANGFTIEQEMVLRCLKMGFHVAERASHEYVRMSGYSKLHAAQGFYFLLHFFKEYLF